MIIAKLMLNKTTQANRACLSLISLLSSQAKARNQHVQQGWLTQVDKSKHEKCWLKQRAKRGTQKRCEQAGLVTARVTQNGFTSQALLLFPMPNWIRQERLLLATSRTLSSIPWHQPTSRRHTTLSSSTGRSQSQCALLLRRLCTLSETRCRHLLF